jgi:hypothetical protein
MIFCVGWVEPTGAAIKPARGETHRNVSRASVGFAKSSTHPTRLRRVYVPGGGAKKQRRVPSGRLQRQ